MSEKRLPYFDFLLSQLGRHNATIEKSFGRHVHWGYWPYPERARCDDDDYAQAAEQLTLALCELAQIAEGERVLDVGCGFGGTLASLNERYHKLDMVGLNIDDRQLARARAMVQPLAENRVEFCQGDACELPFPDASVDRLLAVECIFHFASRERFFQEAQRVLKPGGMLSLSDFVPSAVFLPVSRLSTSRMFEKINFFGSCDVQFTVARYRRLARRVGLESVAERNVTSNILPTYSYLKGLLADRKGDASMRRALKAGYMADMLSWLGRTGLLNYYLLSFRKPVV